MNTGVLIFFRILYSCDYLF